MKSYITLSLLVLLSNTSILIAQNPAFYEPHPTNNDIQWYYQINETPVIIRNNNIVNESRNPNWYNALQFVSCPGVFTTVSEAYSYLSERPEFLSDNNNYFNRSKPLQQQKYIESNILDRSISYASNQAAKGDFNPYVLSGCRESVIFGELYLRINNEEFLLLDYMSMYLFDLDSESNIDLNLVLGYLKGNNNNQTISNAIATMILHKENGIWKYVIGNKAYAYIEDIGGDFGFTNNSSGNPIVHIRSTINSSRNRVFNQL